MNAEPYYLLFFPFHNIKYNTKLQTRIITCPIWLQFFLARPVVPLFVFYLAREGIATMSLIFVLGTIQLTVFYSGGQNESSSKYSPAEEYATGRPGISG
jgi:hypothetical protein